MWEVWAGRARDIGVLDLELGLEAGPEPEPEAVYSTALKRGSLARTRNAMLLFRQLNRRPAGDPGGIKKAREPGRLLTSSLYFALYRSTEQLREVCSENYTVCGGRIFSVLSFISRER